MKNATLLLPRIARMQRRKKRRHVPSLPRGATECGGKQSGSLSACDLVLDQLLYLNFRTWSKQRVMREGVAA
jgi:hypothetical protein